MTDVPKYSKKDFVSNQEVRWCPGCGDYSILASVQLAMTKLQIPKEKIVFISGIGCSSRFPYYMDTYGLHTIHGRAPALATGLKLHNPDLSTWVISGDGDSLSIGGNHLIHAIRRNININILIFNNEIYGLTKGQYSPTSSKGLVTKSSPFGSLDRPFKPAQLVLGAGSTFFARTLDTDPKHMQEIFLEAAKHQGTSVIEILQNCVIFNDKVHDAYTNRQTRDDYSLRLEDGKPMIFGKNSDKGVVMTKEGPQSVTLGDEYKESDLIVHNKNAKSNSLALALGEFTHPDMPVPLGVFWNSDFATLDDDTHKQILDKQKEGCPKDVTELLMSGNTWEVK